MAKCTEELTYGKGTGRVMNDFRFGPQFRLINTVKLPY